MPAEENVLKVDEEEEEEGEEGRAELWQMQVSNMHKPRLKQSKAAVYWPVSASGGR